MLLGFAIYFQSHFSTHLVHFNHLNFLTYLPHLLRLLLGLHFSLVSLIIASSGFSGPRGVKIWKSKFFHSKLDTNTKMQQILDVLKKKLFPAYSISGYQQKIS